MVDKEHWLRKNWATVLALLLIFGLALFLRVYFVYGLAMPDRLYSGGSDSFYYEKIIEHAFETGEQLTHDPLLAYPMGLVNPRPPLFAWFAVLSGWVVSPGFATPWDAITFMFILSTALFGALTVFPTYALVREAFDRRAGLIAAFLLAVSPGHLQRSMATNADHDAFVLFFVVTGYFFFLRALESLNEKKWVESWRRPAAIRTGVALFLRENRTAVLYSLMSGLSLTAVALTWQGWAYAPIILLVYFVFQLLFHRLRGRDPMGITIVFGITMGTALLLAAPWYVEMNQVKTWFDVPAYLFAAAFALGAVLTVTRDYPWTLVLPTVIGAASIALGVGILVNPALANAFVSGAGYFVQTKLYETIAEAQAPALSQIILSFGVGTYFLSLGALGYLLWLFLSGKRTQTAYLFFVVWTLAAVVMAQAAARFIFNAAPAFAATAGFAIGAVVQRLGFDGLKRTYLSVAGGSRRAAIRKSVKARHVLGAVAIIFLLFLPNVWWAVDAAIPFERKYEFDRQVYDVTPGFLRPADYETLTAGGNPFYFGAFGFSLPETKEYFPAAWEWLAAQDEDVAPPDRPAFLSWWDYGFEAVDKGAHPTVADNFQNGYHLAGNVISAQSENEVIALLSLRLVEGDFYANGRAFSAKVRAALDGAGINPDALELAFRTPAGLVPTVHADPERYGYYDDEIQPTNALYIYAGDVLTSRLDVDRQAELYRAIRLATERSIRYFALDARLFPSSASNTGIFYAPMKLSDHRVIELRDGRVLPADFFRIYVTVRNNRIPIERMGEFDRPDDPRGEIEYRPMFYDSFFYRVYVGFTPTEAGQAEDKGIPGLSGDAQSLEPLPAWNLGHWRIVYRTAYYNPHNDTQNHTNDWRAINYFDGLRIQQNITAGKATGAVDLRHANTFSQGLLFAKYYDGAFVNGTVTLGGTAPVPGVRVTVTDELGVPHDEAVTDANGRYSVLAPFGEVRVTASTGAVDGRTRVGATVLNAATIVVTDEAAMREDVDADGDGRPDWLITKDFSLPTTTLSGRVYQDQNGDNRFDDRVDRTLAGVPIEMENRALGVTNTTVSGPDGRYEFRDVYRGAAYFNVTLSGRRLDLASQDVPTTPTARDMVVPSRSIAGRITDQANVGVEGVEVSVTDRTNGTILQTVTDEAGNYSVRGLLRGTYDVVASSWDLVSLPAVATLDGVVSGLNLTVYPSGTLAGTAYVGGNIQPFVTFELGHLQNRELRRVVTAGADGRYSVVLPQGPWSVTGRHFTGGRLYAVLAEVRVTRAAAETFHPLFVDAVEVRGVAYTGTAANVSRGASLTFRSPSGSLLLARTSNFGTYLVYLPKGTHDVHAILGSQVFVDRRTFDADTTFDMPLVTKPLLESAVYRDMDRNGAQDAGEGVPAARVSILDPQGRTLTVFTRPDGAFSAPLDPATRYTVSLALPGYAPVTEGPAVPAALPDSIPVVANNVTVSGRLLWNGAPVTGTSIPVRFVAVGQGAVRAATLADGQGRFSRALQPGNYRILVDENVSAGNPDVRWMNAGEDPLTVSVGQDSLTQDVDVVQRARVTGTVTLEGTPVDAPVRFEGPEAADADTSLGRFEVFLATGTYNAIANHTVGSETWLFVGSLTVSGPVDFPMPLSRAAEVGGRVTVNGEPFAESLEVAFARSPAGVFRAVTGSTGTYQIALLEGAYGVTVDERSTITVGGVERFVRIAFSGSLTISPGDLVVGYDVAAARSFDNSTVRGRVTLGGEGIPASLRFSERAVGAMNATAASGPDGVYTVPLHPGTYNVHAVATGSPDAFLGTLTVSLGTDATLDIPLLPASVVTGITTFRDGVRVAADITFSGLATAYIRSDATTGAYRIALPAGTYSVTTRTSDMENGVTIVHATTASLVLPSAEPLNLALERLTRRGVALSWDESERTTVVPGGTVVYTITVQNTGNVAEDFIFTGTPTAWTFTFSPSRPRLDFGNAPNSTLVTVTIQTAPDAQVRDGNVTITAQSAEDASAKGEVTLQVGVERRRGVSLVVSSVSPTFDGRFLNYTLTVTNSGNAPEDVALVIPGLAELQARGWLPRFVTAASPERLAEIRNLTVDGNSTQSVTFSLETTGGGTGATATVKAFVENLESLQSTQVIKLNLPVLVGVGRVTATGLNVVTEVELPYPLLAVLITLLACIIAGIVLTTRRKRGK